MKVRVILVEPQEGGNVGAAARAMKNFAFRDLVIAGPRPPEPDEKSIWWASGAGDVLQGARYVETLGEALADAHMSVATTAARERHVHEQLTPAEVARVASRTLGGDETLALVFGRETWGLSGQEIAMCQRTASVPTSTESPTMNLAQAVAVFCYELSKPDRGDRPSDLGASAPGELIAALNKHARALLIDVGFFADTAPDRMCAELQSLAGKRALSRREASLLLSFVRHVHGRLAR